MIRLVRAEISKLVTIWSTYVLLGITTLATGLIGLAIGLAPHRRGIEALLFPARGTPAWFHDVFSAMAVSEDLALVLGILLVTTEYRHKTVTPTYLGEPRRGRVTAAKLVVSVAGGVVVAAAAAVGALVLGGALAGSGYGDTSIMLGAFGHVFPGVLLASILFAIYGVGLGAILKNQVVALVVGLGVSAVVEPIIVGVWPSVGRWLPSQAARSIESVSTTASGGGFGSGLSNLLPSWEGALVLLAYGVVLAAAGSFTTLRADVT